MDSAKMYGEDAFADEEPTKFEKWLAKTFGKSVENIAITVALVLGVALAVGLFVLLPQLISSMIFGQTKSLWRSLVEGVLRVGIYIGYLFGCSCIKDMKRLFMYHGAEHKCINCIEHGLPLTVENVRNSSRQHKRCGTSFLFFVLAISIILLLLIRVESPLMRVVVRIALLPVIAGVSYEVLKLAGNSDNPVVNLLSKPGMAIQKMTTSEPDDGMIEVAIQAVEAVFDWRAYERDNFHTS